jgi:hypothetical protein
MSDATAMNVRMKRYVGQRSRKGKGGKGAAHVFVVQVDGDSRFLQPHHELCKHSDDFEWGFIGGGPAQLAFAMLYDATGDAKLALKLHMEFMRKYCMMFKGTRSWSMDETSVLRAATLLTEEMEGKKAK